MRIIMFNAAEIKDEIIKWIQDYFEENGRDCTAVIGISGGKDSSIAAALCVKALGKNRVFGVLMPQGEQYDINISKELAGYLGIKYCEINIGESVNAVLSSMKESSITPNRQALENIPARIRMTILYAVAAIVNGRVVNTCNISEDWIGYSTKYGDTAGDFSPLLQLTVSEVKEIGRQLSLPDYFVDKTPEDGLCGLTDEENFGFSYDVLDRYIRSGICEDTAAKERIDKLHIASRHKYNPMPFFDINIIKR
jgi:NAD+ synthase